jgi:hypothetical protein
MWLVGGPGITSCASSDRPSLVARSIDMFACRGRRSEIRSGRNAPRTPGSHRASGSTRPAQSRRSSPGPGHRQQALCAGAGPTSAGGDPRMRPCRQTARPVGPGPRRTGSAAEAQREAGGRARPGVAAGKEDSAFELERAEVRLDAVVVLSGHGGRERAKVTGRRSQVVSVSRCQDGGARPAELAQDRETSHRSAQDDRGHGPGVVCHMCRSLLAEPWMNFASQGECGSDYSSELRARYSD